MERVLDCMIDQGVDGICILTNFSEQFSLFDEDASFLIFRIAIKFSELLLSAQIHFKMIMNYV